MVRVCSMFLSFLNIFNSLALVRVYVTCSEMILLYNLYIVIYIVIARGCSVYRDMDFWPYRPTLGHTTRCKEESAGQIERRSTEMSRKSSGTQSYGLMRPRLISSKVMERPKCGERKELLMIQSIQAHL